jgi:carbonic anhydrase/acetyltransferase-like protein (isoleucine patch superfamily)
MLITFEGIAPQIHPEAYVHSSAQVIGDVHMGAQSSAWFNTVIRGDVHYIRIGERTSIQDNSTVHVTGGLHPTLIGDDVTVGHGVILHGCAVGNRCLVGIGSIILDRCKIGDDCIIASGSLLTPGTIVEPGMLVRGHPAKTVRSLRSVERAQLLESARKYIDNVKRYRSQGIE